MVLEIYANLSKLTPKFLRSAYCQVRNLRAQALWTWPLFSHRNFKNTSKTFLNFLKFERFVIFNFMLAFQLEVLTLQSGKDVPLDYLFFQKVHTRKFLLQHPPPCLLIFEPRGHCQNQTQNFPMKVIHSQAFCPLFAVLKKFLHD